ncbi:ATP-binding protein [Solirubrobacter ginsenosidimutans]|uniref:ATP-binding protein n=1 Tax=Solirubrobacter ginsenosidimutans TaxID=490573 RepID=A0A9X3S5Y0_9ACTN|nr:hypothetical protein [Solirubrobacter ginsenosidimutans]MDA0162118.1 ATP-binding protein [Solirubrobacter ginsenosidimutans]
MPAPPRTLASRIARRENAAFVGRTRELLIAETVFADEAPASVLLVRGPAGIGKSVLVREIARRGERAGWARVGPRPLIVVDDHDPADGPALRARLAALPPHAVAVVASREGFDPGWFEGGWETSVVELVLGPLSDHEAHAFLRHQDLAGDPRAGAIVGWAGGLPLALRLAAGAARTDPAWRPGAPAPALRHLGPSAVDPETVRDALRKLQVPRAVPAELRARLDDAAERAFGDTPDEQLLRRVLLRGYFEPAPSHEHAAHELHLSRAAYFRRLRSASERVAAWLAMDSSSTA